MPVAPAIIAAIIGAAATVGTTVYGSIKSGEAQDDAKKQAEQQQAQLAADQKAQAEKDAQRVQSEQAQQLRRAAPDAQAQTGGALTGNPLEALIAQIAGQPGSAQQPFFSASSGLSAGGTGHPAELNFGGAAPQSLDSLSQSLQGGQVSA